MFKSEDTKEGLCYIKANQSDVAKTLMNWII